SAHTWPAPGTGPRRPPARRGVAPAFGPPMSAPCQLQCEPADPVPLLVGLGMTESGHGGEELLQRDDELPAAEVGAEAAVDARAEREMAVGFPVDLDLVRALETVRVTVPGAEHQEAPVTGLELPPADLRVRPAGPGHGLHRRHRPEELFGGRRDQVRLTPQAFLSLGVAGQVPEAGAD